MYSYGQIDTFNYKREIEGITGQWHAIALPDEIFEKINPHFSDIRIYGITAENDTIEAPYLLRVSTGKVTDNNIYFKIINKVRTAKGYYVTFEIPTKEAINQIKLDFKQDNFDWKVRLEGSQNQHTWFRILEGYRILSIKNGQTDYRFTKLTFPEAKYRYFRVFINSKNNPKLKAARITFDTITDAYIKNYPIQKVTIHDKKSDKKTIIDVRLKNKVPVSFLNISIASTFDYYRPFTINYLIDSVKTEQGWHCNYSTLASKTVSSFEKNNFTFNSTVLQQLQLIIYNYDNEPLKIDSLQVKGYGHQLIARFTKPATYYLTYGNATMRKPNYDLNYLTDKIPDSLTTITLKNEEVIDQKENNGVKPLFTDKKWLWAIMIIIILVLGGFTLKMIRNK